MNITITVEALQVRDVETVLRLARVSGLYTPTQLGVIAERCAGFLRGQREDDYEVMVIRVDATARGFVIFRKRSLTEAAFEIGQIGGSESGQIAHLLETLRHETLKRNGRLIFAELPDRPEWQFIHEALQRAGYAVAGQTPHLYAPGAGTRHYALHLSEDERGSSPTPGLPPAHPTTRASHPTGATTLSVVPTTSAHRAAILDMTTNTSVFVEEDHVVVEELLELYLNRGPAEGYYFLSCLAGEVVVAYVCYGPRPSTSGAYDLYWICADPRRRQQGAGRRLMAAVEAHVLERGGYLVLLETSDTTVFAPTRAFYEALGYARVVHIERFYSESDGLVVYAKYLRPV